MPNTQLHIKFFPLLITYALPQAVLLDSDLHALDSWYIHKIRILPITSMFPPCNRFKGPAAPYCPPLLYLNNK